MKKYFCHICGQTWTARPPTEEEENDPIQGWNYLMEQTHCPKCQAAGTEVKE
jgi:rubredoxin